MKVRVCEIVFLLPILNVELSPIDSVLKVFGRCNYGIVRALSRDVVVYLKTRHAVMMPCYYPVLVNTITLLS